MSQPTETQPALQSLTELVQEQKRQLAEPQQRVDTSHPPHLAWLRRPGLAAFALIGLLITVNGLASASIPAANGVITGCYAKDGSLRVIDTATRTQCAVRRSCLLGTKRVPLGRRASPVRKGRQSPKAIRGRKGPKDQRVSAGHRASRPDRRSRRAWAARASRREWV